MSYDNYISLVRPHLEYGCVVWDPYTSKGKQSLEKVQKFACKMASKRWDSGYEELLEQLVLPSLEQRRTHLKCLLYKSSTTCVTFPQEFFHNFYNSKMNSLSLYQPFAHTKLMLFMFIIYK